LTSKNKKSLSAGKQSSRNLAELIRSLSSELEFHNEKVVNYLSSMAQNGSLETHQTKGNIAKIADQLLEKVRGDVPNADPED
jgi:hypothetical protein